MARSSYIYVVYINLKLFSAFTVKHEMISSLPEDLPSVLQVYRIRDGKEGEVQEITDEVIKEAYV